jgi:hypothetical protein
MATVAFLIHALGERDADGGSGRGDRIYDALLWFKAVKEATRWAVCYPTLAYLAALDEGMYLTGIVADHKEIMLRCDVLVATGGTLSDYMKIMTQAAVQARKPYMDLLDLGPRPLTEWRDETKREIIRRVAALGI